MIFFLKTQKLSICCGIEGSYMGGLETKISDLKEKILHFRLHHCQFHYQASYEFYNIACCYFKISRPESSIKSFEDAISLYKENADAHYYLGLVKYLTGNENDALEHYRASFKYRNLHPEMYVSEVWKYDIYSNIQGFDFPHHTNDNITCSYLKSDKLNNLYQQAKIAYDSKNYADMLEIYLLISQESAKLHHTYHVELADLFFALGTAYFEAGLYYEGGLFASQAIEVDARNPNNSLYLGLINTCKLLTQDNYDEVA